MLAVRRLDAIEKRCSEAILTAECFQERDVPRQRASCKRAARAKVGARPDALFGLEAALDFAIALTDEKGDFVGRSALERMSRSRERRLVGITSEGPRVPRQGYELFQDDALVGRVCSGGVSPTLGTNIGSAFVRSGQDREGLELELDVRGKRQACKVRELPFYSRTRKKKN